MRYGKIYKNVEFYGGSNMSQIDWDRIVADADNEARKKVQKESENGQNSLDFISKPHVTCCLLVDISSSMQGSEIDELNRTLQHFKKTFVRTLFLQKGWMYALLNLTARPQLSCPLSHSPI